MKTNSELKNAALAALKGNWAEGVLCIATYLFIYLILYAVASIPFFFVKVTTFSLIQFGLLSIGALLILGPFIIGIFNSFNKLYTERDNDLFHNSFKFGFTGWGRIVLGYLLKTLIVFAGTIVLLVPGIIFSLNLSMVPFILIDHPELSPTEAISLSRKLMCGHKADLFLLVLSFIGWFLLSILTLGIGYLWLAPYYYETIAAFYQDIIAETPVE